MMPGDVDIALATENETTVSLPESVEVFRAMCQLWTTFLPMARIYHGPGRQLLTWADQLPLRLVRQPGNSHAVYLMQ
jgi:hypothetical protein